MKTEKLVCGLDETQIAALKKKNGFLVIVTITQGGTEIIDQMEVLKAILETPTVDEKQKKKAESDLAILKDKYEKENTFHAIFKEPTFDVLEATGAIGKNNEIKGTIALYDNCIVKADEEINNRDFAKLKALEGLAKHMNSFSVNVKNL